MMVGSQVRHGSALAFCAIASCAAAFSAWQVQEWRYGRQLEQLARLQSETLNEITQASATAQSLEQAQRFSLEQHLHASQQHHQNELTDAQRNQKRLLDRLATSELRLSVLIASSDAGGSSMPATPASSFVVHGPHRAELDPAHARRIVGITHDGDRGLIALRACQAFARQVTRSP